MVISPKASVSPKSRLVFSDAGEEKKEQVGDGKGAADVSAVKENEEKKDADVKIATKAESSSSASKPTTAEKMTPNTSWPMSDLQDNEQALKSWKQGDQIGRGAYGEVFRALVEGRFMAVKKIPIRHSYASSSGEAAIERESNGLRTEIGMLSKLKHPRIVSYEGCLVTDAHVLIFMDLMPGGSIRSMLKKFGPFDHELVRKITRQVLEGLRFLHNRRIIHRDIKGANILMDRHGDAKLADFGAAQQLDVLFTQVSGGFKSIHGSVYWMAPEVLWGPAGRRSDIWSLGCTVIEMCSARHPWPNLDGQTLASALRTIGESEQLPPLPDTMSKEIIDFVKLCLRRDFTQRPYTKDLLLRCQWLSRPTTPSIVAKCRTPTKVSEAIAGASSKSKEYPAPEGEEKKQQTTPNGSVIGVLRSNNNTPDKPRSGGFSSAGSSVGTGLALRSRFSPGGASAGRLEATPPRAPGSSGYGRPQSIPTFHDESPTKPRTLLGVAKSSPQLLKDARHKDASYGKTTIPTVIPHISGRIEADQPEKNLKKDLKNMVDLTYSLRANRPGRRTPTKPTPTINISIV